MQKRIPIKNHHQEIQLISYRTMLGLVLLFLLLATLICRLAYLQIYKHTVFSTLSTKNWLDLVPIEPTRGLIYDRNGILLAENIPVFSLDLLPYKTKDLTYTLGQLSKLASLSEDDISQFQKQLKQHRRFDEIPLKLRLSEEEVARLTENLYRFPGVVVKARLMRSYPLEKTFSHVLGYVGRINAQELNQIDQINYSASHYIGKLGVEKFYEEALHGQVGYEEVENDASGKPIRILKEIKGSPGKNIYLTLDVKLQQVVEDSLSGHRGAVVAIQPSTGQVLAMVSEPGYDPNLFVTGISQKSYDALQNSEDKPLFNRAIRGLYPPASTVKPFFALQGLDTGIINEDYTVQDQGTFKLHNHSRPFHDWVKFGHGTVNLSKAIISSCDIYFYDLATRLGIRRMDHILEQFGFGKLSGIDISDELPGVVPTPEWKQQTKGQHWFEGDTILSGIGQGYVQTTPLQLAVATATLANRGKRIQPYLLLAYQSVDKKLEFNTPVVLPELKINDSHWDSIIKAMQDVVAHPRGTASHYGKNLAYSIAAKTGTAQVSKRRIADEMDKQADLPEKLRDHHLFIAFAPVDNPQIALAVVTENSYVTLEVAKKIFDYYLGVKK